MEKGGSLSTQPASSVSLPLSSYLSLSPFLFSPSPSPLGRFRISQVQLADAGIFTCVAASPAGVADRNFTLQVQGMEQGVGQGGLWPWWVRSKALGPPAHLGGTKDGPWGHQGEWTPRLSL